MTTNSRFGGSPSPQTIRPSGGRSQPRTSELKDSAEKRIVKLFKQSDSGCRLTSIPPPLSIKDKKRLKEQVIFASTDRMGRIDILNNKLIELLDRKISLAGKLDSVLDQKIEKLEQEIADLIDEK